MIIKSGFHIEKRKKYGKKKKKTEDGVPLLPDVGGKSDPGASWTEVGPELWE